MFNKKARCLCYHSRRLLTVLILSIVCNALHAYYEARPVIRMSDVLTSQQAQSVYHRVEDIELDGKYYIFRVYSDMASPHNSYSTRRMA